MGSNQHFDIIIVGGGMVGMAQACAIAKVSLGQTSQSLKIAVIEAQSDLVAVTEPSYHGRSFDPRVSALSLASQKLLQSISAWPGDYGMRVCPYDHMSVWDAEGTGGIEFSAREAGQEYLGHIVENSAILAALYRVAKTHENICIISPCRVTGLQLMSAGLPNHIYIDDAGQYGGVLSCQLIIAADGVNSLMRELAKFEVREWDYGHSAIVTTVESERGHAFTAWQRFLPQGPLAFLPLLIEPLQSENLSQDKLFAKKESSALCHTKNHDTHFCSIVWSAVPDFADELMSLTDDAFARALERAFELRFGVVRSVDKRFSYPLRQRHAKSYCKTGIVLLGDAAHTIHPLAGQGVNLGFSDVLALTEEITRALQKGMSLSNYAILKRYQRVRMPKNLAMMAAMEGFKSLFGQTALPIRWLRNEGMRRMNKMSLVKRKLIEQAMGI